MSSDHSVKPPGEEDELLYEVDLYMTKCDSGELYVLQYPSHNKASMNLDEVVNKVRLKPNCKLMEMCQAVETDDIYHTGKGKQLAINVDGVDRNLRDSKDNHFSSDCMDKSVMRSSPPIKNCDNYAIGYSLPDGGGLCLSPIDCILPFNPAMDYLDKAKEKSAKEKKTEDEEPTKDKEVTVKFQKEENEKAKSKRESSFNHMLKKIENEPWIEMEYSGLDEATEEIKNMTIGNVPNDSNGQILFNSSYYLSLLVNSSSEGDTPTRDTSESVEDDYHNIPRCKLYDYSIEKQLEVVMRRVGVCQFDAVLDWLEKEGGTDEAVIAGLMCSACIVRGCFVVKSNVLYSPFTFRSTFDNDFDNTQGDARRNAGSKNKTVNNPLASDSRRVNLDTIFTKNGTSHSKMKEVRDYILYLFATNTEENYTLKREEIGTFFPIHGEDLVTLLTGVAKPIPDREGKLTGSWQFMYPTDTKFIQNNSKLITRQDVMWTLSANRYRRLQM